MRASIIGTGSYLPEKILTNEELSEVVDTTDEWIQKRTGILKRHIANTSESVLDLAFNASKDLDKKIDALIVATYSAEERMPSVACKLAQKLGIHSAAAFDIITTFTFSPFLFSGSFKYFISDTLFGEYILSPVIIIYFACLKLVPLYSDFFSKVIESIGSISVSVVFNNGEYDSLLNLVNPISSNANAIGTTPPSIN